MQQEQGEAPTALPIEKAACRGMKKHEDEHGVWGRVGRTTDCRAFI